MQQEGASSWWRMELDPRQQQQERHNQPQQQQERGVSAAAASPAAQRGRSWATQGPELAAEAPATPPSSRAHRRRRRQHTYQPPRQQSAAAAPMAAAAAQRQGSAVWAASGHLRRPLSPPPKRTTVEIVGDPQDPPPTPHPHNRGITPHHTWAGSTPSGPISAAGCTASSHGAPWTAQPHRPLPAQRGAAGQVGGGGWQTG